MKTDDQLQGDAPVPPTNPSSPMLSDSSFLIISQPDPETAPTLEINQDSTSQTRPPSRSRSCPRSRSSSSSHSLSQSASSSDISIIHRKLPSVMSPLATVEDHNSKIPPTLTPGKVTPEILHRWEKLCKKYFRIKKVAEKLKVESVLSRIQDLRLADWYHG